MCVVSAAVHECCRTSFFCQEGGKGELYLAAEYDSTVFLGSQFLEGAYFSWEIFGASETRAHLV